jgi:hypothetical protein
VTAMLADLIVLAIAVGVFAATAAAFKWWWM